MFWPAPATPRRAVPQTRLFGREQRRGVGHEGLEVVGRLQALRLVEILAIDLHGDFAVVGNAEELAVDAVGGAPGRNDVVELEPVRVGQRCIGEVGVERLDPFVRRVERVIHRVGGMGGVGAGLRREVDDALLPDLRRRNLLEADGDAGERLELRRERDQVVEVARRDDGDRDGLAGGLPPVDLGRLVRREVRLLGAGAADQTGRSYERRGRHGALQEAAARWCEWIHVSPPMTPRCRPAGLCYKQSAML